MNKGQVLGVAIGFICGLIFTLLVLKSIVNELHEERFNNKKIYQEKPRSR